MILLRLFLDVFTADSLKKHTPYVTRKRALYENCRLLAPDNELLSLIDTRKVNWYFERDLAGSQQLITFINPIYLLIAICRAC